MTHLGQLPFRLFTQMARTWALKEDSVNTSIIHWYPTQFRYGLRNDVKDLLLTFPEEPKSLIEAIGRAVRCDNRLFERRSEHQ